MSVTYPTMVDKMYTGGMSENQMRLILDTISQKSIPNLAHSIFDFPKDVCLYSYENQVSARSIVENNGDSIEKYRGTLRDYQTVGTAFMYFSNRSILGDGVGAGKTAEIAALINVLHQLNVLTRFIMFVEGSAQMQTVLELIRFTGLNVISLPSTAAQMRKVITKTDWNTVDGVVTTHSAIRSDILSRWLSLYLDENGQSRIFNTMILDESSVIKNRETKTFNYLNNICKIVQRVHFLNATTFDTIILDIYNQIDILHPELLPKKWRIEKEYCTWGTVKYWTRDEMCKPKLNTKREITGYKNQSEFKKALKLVYFGRSKAEVGKELPHTYVVYTVEPTTEQSVAMAKGYRYMEVLNSPTNIPEINIPFTRKAVPKLDRLLTLVKEQFDDDKIMVYCFHIEAQEAIAQELRKLGKKVAILNGATPQSERNQIMMDFNTGDTDVLITNVQRSLNLYNGSVCIMYSMSFTPSRMEQIRGRIDRSIDNSLKTFVLLLYKGTDEYNFFKDVVGQRSKDSRELTIDAKTAVDFFVEAIQSGEEK